MFAPQPYYCEENAWWIAGDPALEGSERLVLVISAAGGEVACWSQRAGRGAVICWDYHVVVAVRRGVWWIRDPDCELGPELSAAAWLGATFPHAVPEAFAPRFLVLTAARYRRMLRTDRGHMRAADGTWQQPPPPWPPPQGAVALMTLVRRARQGCDLATLRQRLDPRVPRAITPGAGRPPPARSSPIPAARPAPAAG